MLSKNELKYYRTLLQKKHRIKEGKFIVEGRRLVEEGLKSDFDCEIIFSTKEFKENNTSLFKKSVHGNERAEVLKTSEFHKLSDTQSPQGISAVFKIKEFSKSEISKNVVVALENISDPGNLGTIFRNSDWFGISEVLLNNECAEIYNPKVLRASMGSIFHLQINEFKNLTGKLSEYKSSGYDIVCTDLNGDNLYEVKPAQKTIIVFCSEANGPSKQLLSIADKKITIPSKGNAESLNVASASAVILSELTK